LTPYSQNTELKLRSLQHLSEKPGIDRSEKIAGLLSFTLIHHSRAMLIVARNSQDFACCARER
jgi:hypothetical protein